MLSSRKAGLLSAVAVLVQLPATVPSCTQRLRNLAISKESLCLKLEKWLPGGEGKRFQGSC